jgi:hypothetical protein
MQAILKRSRDAREGVAVVNYFAALLMPKAVGAAANR